MSWRCSWSRLPDRKNKNEGVRPVKTTAPAGNFTPDLKIRMRDYTLENEVRIEIQRLWPTPDLLPRLLPKVGGLARRRKA